MRFCKTQHMRCCFRGDSIILQIRNTFLYKLEIRYTSDVLLYKCNIVMLATCLQFFVSSCRHVYHPATSSSSVYPWLHETGQFGWHITGVTLCRILVSSSLLETPYTSRSRRDLSRVKLVSTKMTGDTKHCRQCKARGSGPGRSEQRPNCLFLISIGSLTTLGFACDQGAFDLRGLFLLPKPVCSLTLSIRQAK